MLACSEHPDPATHRVHGCRAILIPQHHSRSREPLEPRTRQYTAYAQRLGRTNRSIPRSRPRHSSTAEPCERVDENNTMLLHRLYPCGQDEKALGQPIRHYKSRSIRYTYVKASAPDRTHCTAMQPKRSQGSSFAGSHIFIKLHG